MSSRAALMWVAAGGLPGLGPSAAARGTVAQGLATGEWLGCKELACSAQTIDWTIIAVYLVGITVIGVWAAKRVKSAASFFIGDRKFGKWMMLFFMFGTGTHSDQAVGVAAKTYGSGVSGIWYEWLYLFVTPFYWVIAPIFRRMRAVTTADYFEMRYGRSVSMLFVVVGLLQLTFFIGMMLKGTSAMVTAVSGGMIDDRVAIVAMTVMFVLYGVAGGMAAAIVTDLVQGLLTVVLSFLVLPFAWSAAGDERSAGAYQRSGYAEAVAPGRSAGLRGGYFVQCAIGG